MLGKKRLNHNLELIFLILAAVLIAVVTTWKITSHPVSSSQKDLNKVKSQVGKLILLPTDEQPTLATVTDRAKLKDKFLAAKSETGDRVLIYTKNKLVIIYRPNINKIVAVGLLTADPALPESKGATLTVLDSTNDPSRKQNIINKIKTAYPDIKITDGGKADVTNLPNTIVIDNTAPSRKSNLQVALENIIPGKEGIIPLGQTRPSTDMTIIVGADK